MQLSGSHHVDIAVLLDVRYYLGTETIIFSSHQSTRFAERMSLFLIHYPLLFSTKNNNNAIHSFVSVMVLDFYGFEYVA